MKLGKTRCTVNGFTSLASGSAIAYGAKGGMLTAFFISAYDNSAGRGECHIKLQMITYKWLHSL